MNHMDVICHMTRHGDAVSPCRSAVWLYCAHPFISGEGAGRLATKFANVPVAGAACRRAATILPAFRDTEMRNTAAKVNDVAGMLSQIAKAAQSRTRAIEGASAGGRFQGYPAEGRALAVERARAASGRVVTCAATLGVFLDPRARNKRICFIFRPRCKEWRVKHNHAGAAP